MIIRITPVRNDSPPSHFLMCKNKSFILFLIIECKGSKIWEFFVNLQLEINQLKYKKLCQYFKKIKKWQCVVTMPVLS